MLFTIINFLPCIFLIIFLAIASHIQLIKIIYLFNLIQTIFFQIFLIIITVPIQIALTMSLFYHYLLIIMKQLQFYNLLFIFLSILKLIAYIRFHARIIKQYFNIEFLFP